jgi:hypothetical protein
MGGFGRRPRAVFLALLSSLVVLPVAVVSWSASAGAGPVTDSEADQHVAPVVPSAGIAAGPGVPGGSEPLVAVPEDDRAAVLAPGWEKSSDRAWTARGDDTGFHLLIADEADGYRWRTVATLAVDGIQTDRWVGNVCFTESGDRAVVVYGPRAFSNDVQLMERGGFVAVVEVESGQVDRLSVRASLAYFNPGCGAGERAVLTQLRGSDQLDVDLATRLLVVDAARAEVVGEPIEVEGQVTSAVPTRDGVVAAFGSELVVVEPDGVMRTIAKRDGVVYKIVPDESDGLVFMDHDGDTARVLRADSAKPGGAKVAELARGVLSEVTLSSGAGGRPVIVGEDVTVSGTLPGSVSVAEVSASAEVSTEGRFAIMPEVWIENEETRSLVPSVEVKQPVEPGGATPVEFIGRIIATDAEVRFGFTPGTPASDSTDLTEGGESSTGGSEAAKVDGLGAGVGEIETLMVGGDPWDADAFCAVPRNDPDTQVYQPTTRQVEWAANQVARGALNVVRAANWKQAGMLSSWSPQAMFPKLNTAKVNPNVLNGILMTESNLWQASKHALSGVPGNPLVGNYYGLDHSVEGPDFWTIDWADSDCGYGISQVTDGMRKAGHEKPGETALPADKQRAVVVDYATNVAAGVRILEDKWNQTTSAGVIHSDGDPYNPENWYFAIWAYNSGFHPYVNPDLPWGVGWVNNPINPNWDPDRGFFHKNAADASHPQDWPYPEKVMGFAAYPPETRDGGDRYAQAWWGDADYRDLAKPPIDHFCTPANNCDPSELQPCLLTGEPECWWHWPTEFNDCDAPGGTWCGHPNYRFGIGDPEPSDGDNYPPNCGLDGLPPSALVVDDVPGTAFPISTTVRPCALFGADDGEFSFEYGTNPQGQATSKIDLHQIGGGFNGHFWFAHTRTDGYQDDRLKITGTWEFDEPLNGWGRVLVHMPDHGAHTQQARYRINLGDGTTKTRYALQRTRENRWVSLGVMEFNGTPSISLSNVTIDGYVPLFSERDGLEDVAWDAVAIVPLQAKPEHFVVAMGDSFSSGEGASENSGEHYYVESDNNGDNEHRNACHRSVEAWPRKAVLADNPLETIGEREDRLDPSVDFQFLACSGAETENLLASGSVNAFGDEATGKYREMSQFDKGYLDENTTLVMFSIGGNDGGFSDVMGQCVIHIVLPGECWNADMPGYSEPMVNVLPQLLANEVPDSINLVLNQVSGKAPNATIILMGYPELFGNPSESCLLIPDEDQQWINSLSVSVMAMMESVAADARARGIDVLTADPIAEFSGAGVCGTPETIHGLKGPNPFVPWPEGDEPFNPLEKKLVSNESIHPKISGTDRYAEALNETLSQMGG